MPEQELYRDATDTKAAVASPDAKQAYEPPQAAFVPLQPEEQLMACGKVGPPLSCSPTVSS